MNSLRQATISESNVTAALEMFMRSMKLLDDNEFIDAWSTLGGPLEVTISKEVSE